MILTCHCNFKISIYQIKWFEFIKHDQFLSKSLTTVKLHDLEISNENYALCYILSYNLKMIALFCNIIFISLLEIDFRGSTSLFIFDDTKIIDFFDLMLTLIYKRKANKTQFLRRSLDVKYKKVLINICLMPGFCTSMWAFIYTRSILIKWLSLKIE